MAPSTAANIASAVVALIAAGLWWRASKTLVSPKSRQGPDGTYSASITRQEDDGFEWDPIETIKEGSRRNAGAAMAACLAAALQAVGLLLFAAGR